MPARKPKDMPREALELIAERFKLLSDPTRLELLQLLRASERSVGELAEAAGIGQPSASKHLALLQAAGVVDKRRAGRSVLYRISDPLVFELCEGVCDSLATALDARSVRLRRSGIRRRK